MADNAGSNAPRMLTWLAEADRRGAQLVHINPLIEAASRRTIVPHELVDMATFHTTEIGTMNVQVRIGGDLALLRGVAKVVFEAAAEDPGVLDREFIEQYTQGIDEYRALVEATPPGPTSPRPLLEDTALKLDCRSHRTMHWEVLELLGDFPVSLARGDRGVATSVRVLVLPPSTGLGGLGLRRSLEQETVVRRDERVGRHHRVGVVDGPVLAREGDPARTLAQPVLELGPDLA